MLLLVLIAGLPAVVTAQQAVADPGSARNGTWIGPDGKPLPFTSHEQLCEFLRTASVKASYDIPTGTSEPRRLLLEKDGVRLHAIFRTVDVAAFNVQSQASHQQMLKDSYVFEVAAYKLSLLLGLDNVPPAVLRELDGNEGSLQLWVEQTQSIADIAEQGIVSKYERWVGLQKLNIILFDYLIYNFDRNTGNMLVDQNGKLWFVDHTRTFTKAGDPPNPGVILVCDRSFWEHLNALDQKQVKAELKPYLDAGQISSLFRRRKLLIRHIEQLIEDKGESEVLFDLQKLDPTAAAPGPAQPAGNTP
jgi:hypothetical protein